MIKFKIDSEGGFTVGNTNTEQTAYAYPSSTSAVRARRFPEQVAAEMLGRAMAFRPEHLEFHKRNWLRINNR